MLIENKWTVYETHTGLYYAGNDTNGYPTPQPLSSTTRQYATQRAAKCAIDRITEISEGYDFVAKYIDSREVPDTEEAEWQQLSEIPETKGWREVYGFAVPGTSNFGKIRLCLNNVNGIEVFGVKDNEGKLYSAGYGGGEKALRQFCKMCYEYLLPRVTRQQTERIK